MIDFYTSRLVTTRKSSAHTYKAKWQKVDVKASVATLVLWIEGNTFAIDATLQQTDFPAMLFPKTSFVVVKLFGYHDDTNDSQIWKRNEQKRALVLNDILCRYVKHHLLKVVYAEIKNRFSEVDERLSEYCQYH